jgi:opacity protein-like surface antigen
MTRIFLLLLTVTLFAPAALAQDRDYSFYEFYIGYAHQRVDRNAGTFDKNGRAIFNGTAVRFQDERVGYDGFTAEFNQNVHRNVGIVTSFTAGFDDKAFVDVNTGREFAATAQRYDLMIGPRFNWRNSRVTPFGHALFGISHTRIDFDDPLSRGARSATAFAMAFGGGVDVHVSDDIDVRPIVVDYVPTYYNSKRQDNFRIGAGIKIR